MKKAGNIAFLVVMTILTVFLLYNIYNRFIAKAQLEPVKPQTSENRGDTKEPGDEGRQDSQQAGNDGQEDTGDTGSEKTDDEDKEDDEKIMAPDFTLEDMDGNKVSLSDYKGKIVFLNFWATWCPFCVREMPDLEKVHQEFSKGNDAVMLTINSGEKLEKAKKFMDDKKLTLPVLMDYTNEVGGIYGVSGIPVTYVIDRDGAFYGRISGPTDKDTIMGIVDKLK